MRTMVRTAMAARPLALIGVLSAWLVGAGLGGCRGDIGNAGTNGGTGGTTASGTGGTTAAGGSGTTASGSGGATGSSSSGTAGSGGAGGTTTASSSGTGGTTSSGSGGSGGDPLICDTSGPQDCSPHPSAYDYVGPPAKFHSQVNAAVAAVRDGNPSWFDYNQGPAPCCPLALDTEAFLNGVVAHVNGSGLCAQRDPNNPNIEITVKKNNDCAEGYSVLTSASIVRSPAHYNYGAVPAWW